MFIINHIYRALDQTHSKIVAVCNSKTLVEDAMNQIFIEYINAYPNNDDYFFELCVNTPVYESLYDGSDKWVVYKVASDESTVDPNGLPFEYVYFVQTKHC